MVVFIETIPKASLDATEADITDSPDTAHVSAGLDLNKAGVGLDRQVPMTSVIAECAFRQTMAPEV
jgi:hypothetical protein